MVSSKVRMHFRQNVVGYVAIFMSLMTGTAWALEAGSVTSQHIKDDAVRSIDVRDGAGVAGGDVVDESLSGADLGPDSVGLPELDPAAFDDTDIGPAPGTGRLGILDSAITGDEIENGSLSGDDIWDGSLTGAHIANSTITGDDVYENSLSEVPSARSARSVNGEYVQPIEFLAGPNTPLRILLAAGGLLIRATCTSSGDLEVYATTDRNARLFTWSFDVGGIHTNNEFDLETFTSSYLTDLVQEDDGDQVGHTVYMTSGGSVTIIEWAADNNTSSTFSTQCAFVGTAVSH